MYTRVVRLPTPEHVSDVVAHRLLQRLIDLQGSQPIVHVCLTGGNAANAMYETFARLTENSELDASKLQLWWGDERFLPATDPDRNSLQAVSLLARTVSFKSADTHMMPAQDGRKDPHECAAEYEAELGDTHFDITLLGIGEDGHVASLFPDHPSFNPATTRLVIGVTDAPKAPAERITLTLPALNRSDEIWVIATGAGKASAVARALEGDERLPAAHVHAEAATIWYLDDEAAGGLAEQFRCPE